MVIESTACEAGAKDNSFVAGPDDRIDVPLMLRAAVEGLGCPHKVAADAVGYDASYWARVLTAERGITLDRLGLLPLDVQRSMVTRWAGALGILPPPGYAELMGLADLIATRRVKVTIESR